MKVRKKRSVIWEISEENFVNLIKNSKTMSQVLAFFDLQNKGGNFLTCKKRIKELGLSTSHFLTANKSSNFSREIKLEDFILKLTTNSTYSNHHLKKFLIKFNILEYKCNSCGNCGDWNGKQLSLQIEHKNGISNDNTITNLEFLCPNCHSQTKTYAGKSLKKRYSCDTCGKSIGKINKSKKCAKCLGITNRLYSRPEKEELEELVKNKSISKIAEDFNVGSDSCIRKWCDEYKIDYKTLSPFSRRTKEKSVKIKKETTSKYNYVSFYKAENKWLFALKKTKDRPAVRKRFKTELEAAQAVADYFNSNELILR